MDDDDEIQVFDPPDTLKAKVGTGGPGAVDLETLERAEAVIADLTDDYLKWAEEDLDKIEGVVKELSAATDNHKELLGRIFQIAHDIKGQGGSFGYEMMTVIGDKLCRFVEKLDVAEPAEVEAISLHVNTMKVVISKRMQGEGGKEGAALFDGLNRIVAKIMNK